MRTLQYKSQNWLVPWGPLYRGPTVVRFVGQRSREVAPDVLGAQRP